MDCLTNERRRGERWRVRREEGKKVERRREVAYSSWSSMPPLSLESGRPDSDLSRGVRGHE